VLEEISRRDSGIAVAVGVTAWAITPGIVAGNRAVVEMR